MTGGTWVTLLESARLQARLTRRYPMLYALNIIQPVALLAIVMRTAQPDPVRNGDLLLSVLLTSFWGSTIWAAGGILRRDQYYGTLARTVVNARNGAVVVIGRCLGAIGTSLVTLAVLGFVAAFALRRPVALPGVPILVVGFAGLAVSGTALGLLIACAFLRTRYGTEITSALMYPVFIFGGLLIPAQLVPGWLHWLAWPVSLSWARRFMLDADPIAAAIFVLVTVAYAAAGLVFFRRSLAEARGKGTLDLV
jgi:ABC-2 type transport system permease protein